VRWCASGDRPGFGRAQGGKGQGGRRRPGETGSGSRGTACLTPFRVSGRSRRVAPEKRVRHLCRKAKDAKKPDPFSTTPFPTRRSVEDWPDSPSTALETGPDSGESKADTVRPPGNVLMYVDPAGRRVQRSYRLKTGRPPHPLPLRPARISVQCKADRERLGGGVSAKRGLARAAQRA